MTPSIQLRDK